MSLSFLENLAAEAVACRVCFREFRVHPSKIDIAQPRWIGPAYWSTHPRVAVLMLNPGSGESRTGSADERFRFLLHEFGSGRTGLDAIFKHQESDMPNWGRRRFSAFYFKGLGLSPSRVAFANIAWCSTDGNVYPPGMLRECFGRHTKRLLSILAPDILLLSGSDTYCFADKVRHILPSVDLIKTFHFAHRRGRQAEEAELDRVSILLGLSK